MLCHVTYHHTASLMQFYRKQTHELICVASQTGWCKAVPHMSSDYLVHPQFNMPCVFTLNFLKYSNQIKREKKRWNDWVWSDQMGKCLDLEPNMFSQPAWRNAVEKKNCIDFKLFIVCLFICRSHHHHRHRHREGDARSDGSTSRHRHSKVTSDDPDS